MLPAHVHIGLLASDALIEGDHCRTRHVGNLPDRIKPPTHFLPQGGRRLAAVQVSQGGQPHKKPINTVEQ